MHPMTLQEREILVVVFVGRARLSFRLPAAGLSGKRRAPQTTGMRALQFWNSHG